MNSSALYSAHQPKGSSSTGTAMKPRAPLRRSCRRPVLLSMVQDGVNSTAHWIGVKRRGGIQGIGPYTGCTSSPRVHGRHEPSARHARATKGCTHTHAWIDIDRGGVGMNSRPAAAGPRMDRTCGSEWAFPTSWRPFLLSAGHGGRSVPRVLRHRQGIHGAMCARERRRPDLPLRWAPGLRTICRLSERVIVASFGPRRTLRFFHGRTWR